MHDCLKYVDCVSRCHSRMPPIFFPVQAVNHFAGLAGDAAVGGEVFGGRRRRERAGAEVVALPLGELGMGLDTERSGSLVKRGSLTKG